MAVKNVDVTAKCGRRKKPHRERHHQEDTHTKAIVHHTYGSPNVLKVGKVVPVIERRYPLSEVAEALRYPEEGHAKGKVVITVEHNNKT